MKTGKFYGIGVGPGDPELLTLKGMRLIQSVSVVAFPQGRDGQPGFASRIVERYLKPEQQLRALYMPFVPEQSILEDAWKAAADLLYRDLADGLDVAFLAEGDVSLYSTFTYLLWEFQNRYPQVAIEIVPGVSSPFAAAAALQSPLVIGDETLTILPAMHRIADLEAACARTHTVVLLKVAPVYEEVYAWLAERKLLPDASVVCWVSGEQQAIYRSLEPGLKLPYFSLMVIRGTHR